MTWKIPALADCRPGIAPTEYNVLVAPAEFQEKTAGGILMPGSLKDKEDYAHTQGRLVAVSPLAFTYAKPEEWGDTPKPKAGDAVFVGRFAGALIEGADGKKYKLCKDQDIGAVIEEAA